MKKMIQQSIIGIDNLVAQIYLSWFEEKKSLLTFLFHGLFNDRNEINQNIVDPQQSITTDIFRQFIEYFLEHSYMFITPEDIINGLKPHYNYILITFDDGYYNNHLALSILKEYQVPSTFFISSNHIVENKCFWWDVVYRERRKRNATIKQINREYKSLKHRKNDEIEEYINTAFGMKALCPIADIDRPFTPAELNSFSKEPLVTLGNHTSNHAILTNYSYNGIKSEIENSQSTIYDITGITPNIISYPNGNYSTEVLKISKEIGFKLGIRVHPTKNILPINLQGTDSLLLNRYTLLGNRDVRNQCYNFRNDFQLNPVLISLFRHIKM
jgi:peptidoglycan/xylan/chitin deacetylase (PgdA/CDA1 family)